MTFHSRTIQSFIQMVRYREDMLIQDFSFYSRYKQHGAKLAWISLTLPDTIAPVPELGILDVVLRRYTDDSLILYVGRSLSWEIHTDFLNRVRVNTIQGWQVFSPIPYEEYHPKVAYPNRDSPVRLEVSHHAGHFNQHTYEQLSFFKSDYFQGKFIILFLLESLLVPFSTFFFLPLH